MLRVLALAALVGVGAFGSAEAATISVSPSTQTVVIGNPVSVDIVASLGAGEALGAFDFNLAFSDLILNGTTVVVDPDSKFQEAPLGFEGGAFGPLGVSPLLVNASADTFVRLRLPVRVAGRRLHPGEGDLQHGGLRA